MSEGLGLGKDAIFCGHLENITTILYILWAFGNLVPIWYIFPRFVKKNSQQCSAGAFVTLINTNEATPFKFTYKDTKNLHTHRQDDSRCVCSCICICMCVVEGETLRKYVKHHYSEYCISVQFIFKILKKNI
jgi:hypothetical protein